ncbi:hypothetical protein U9M48_027319 [Paspalum notatum var. saurae]|uniref:Helitron helicase-like domain-containing protein n=1 Tax=Paspalum notatum var. saurae TaxID=547442 RepID=A0AAQ3X064_PASNO
MSVEKRDEKNKKRREARHRNKGPQVITGSATDTDTDTKQLHLNISSDAINIDASDDMAIDSDNCSGVDFTNFSTDGVPGRGDVPENMVSDNDIDWLHRDDSYSTEHMETSGDLTTPVTFLTLGGAHETVCHPPKQNSSRAAYFMKRYKNLTPDVRESKRARDRLYDKTPKRKETKRDYIRRQRELQANTLNPVSIAMENPKFTPEIVHPNSDATERNGSPVSWRDLVIPEISGTPFFPAPTQTEEVGSPDRCTVPVRHKRHVPSGERQSLLARRNQQFEATIVRNLAAPVEDAANVGREGCDAIRDEMTAEDNTNEIHDICQGPAVATKRSDDAHAVPDANCNGDDDEGVIFEEDSDEDEGYLFAGQEEEIDEDNVIDGTQDDLEPIPEIPDQYDKVYSNIPQETHMLKPVDNCVHCNAKKFQYEPPGFCCRNGKIKLSSQTTPDELVRLWSSADADARHFRDNIRFFNGHFSFTSLYCWLDKMTTNMKDCGIYTFRAHGMLYHNMRSFGREAGAERKHLELYFYDDDPSLEHRYRKCRKERLEKDKEVIDHLVRILCGNPYSEHLRRMGQAENLDDWHIEFNLDQMLDQKTYNTPITSEVAAVWVEGSERRGQFSKSVMLHGKDRSSHGIRSYHGCYDALSYPLFFPRGELGWHANIPKADKTMAEVQAYRETHRKRDQNDDDEPDSPSHLCVSVRDYYCYKFQIRPGIFNPILHGKRLFQQFAVDTYIKIESSRLDYIRNNQERLRADLYQGLVDSLHAGEARADHVGKRTVLATSFIGGPCDLRRRFMDAMALVRKYGKPDIFLTMTCNPNWDEIKRELFPGQTPQDRPDLVDRVFHAKLEEMKKLLTKEDILGKVRAYVYVVEFQKRGLPHAHFLLIMQNKYKLTCPEQYDLLISAEIPNKKKYPQLHKMVLMHMMHGPCGTLNPLCPCTKGRGTCRNHYPRPYSDATSQGKDSYPIYRRRENGRKEQVRGAELDNRWVVPYNPYLLRFFNCHINVEACGSIKAVKYLFKYIYKGHDRASVAVREGNKADGDVDEIKQYRDARWVTPPEALWRIYGFNLSQNSPPVMQLQLHLPNMHMVSFHERQNE